MQSGASRSGKRVMIQKNRQSFPKPVGRFWVDNLPESCVGLGRMSTREEKERLALLQGTLDLLILRTLVFGPQHGQGIARAIQQTSEDTLLVEHGALYPALQRLEAQGWIAARWGTSANNRKARFYTLTQAGRKQLVKESTRWRRLSTPSDGFSERRRRRVKPCSDASGR